MVRLVDIYEYTKDKVVLLGKLREWKLVPQDGEYPCPKCDRPMKIYEASRTPEGWKWYCGAKIQRPKQTSKICIMEVLFRKGTFFENSKLSAFQVKRNF